MYFSASYVTLQVRLTRLIESGSPYVLADTHYPLVLYEFFKSGLNAVCKANRQLSRKLKGSNGREKTRLNLARKHEVIANQRRDWFWKLAHKLIDMFDGLCFETLNLKGMRRLWGRKVNDLALGEFLGILEWVAKKKDKLIVYVDRWFPSSKTCSCCGHSLDELDLSVRLWRCPSCHSVNHRDDNASQNIKAAGTLAVGLGDVRQAQLAISV